MQVLALMLSIANSYENTSQVLHYHDEKFR